MSRHALLIIPLTLLAGCTVGPNYKRPEVAGDAGQWVEPAVAGAVDTHWWREFGDPQLTALIEKALAKSPDLAEAEARLHEARANRDAAAGGVAPTLTTVGSANQNALSRNGLFPLDSLPNFPRQYSMFDFGFDASWEIDLWGRVKRKVEATEARTAAAEAGIADVRVMLAAEIARNYLDLRAAQAQVKALTTIAEADGEIARLTRLRFEHGESSRIDHETAGSAARTSSSQLGDARAAAAAAAYRIGVLAGMTPEDVAPMLREPGAQPVSPDSILEGVRSDLLQRRPDVRRAERELAAATAEIGVAKADLFPRFSLLGSVGQQAQDPSDLFTGDSTRFQIGPSFSWPIFNAGTIRAQVHAAGARADAAAASYEKAVLGALGDSETAINRFLNARGTLAHAEGALVAQTAAYQLATRRADRGEDDRLDLMRAEKALGGAERAAIAARQAKAQAAVALFKALGGGWEGDLSGAPLARSGPAR
jgi:NodT family efflux transporter outer membrane factor (OMF) lipoprotein